MQRHHNSLWSFILTDNAGDLVDMGGPQKMDIEIGFIRSVCFLFPRHFIQTFSLHLQTLHVLSFTNTLYLY